MKEQLTLTEVQKAFSRNNVESAIIYPQFSLFADQHPRIIQFQPKAKMNYSKTEGLQYIGDDESRMYNKLRSFLALAKGKCALAIAPELCVPLDFFKNYINERNVAHEPKNWPDKGELWILGMQYIQKDDFNSSVYEYNWGADIICIRTSSASGSGKLINSLMYVFRVETEVNEEKLILLPQIKFNPSKDETETACGEEVYFFTDNASGGMLSTLICSDGFSFELPKFNSLNFEKRLFVHIQLTKDPLHANNEDMLETLLEDGADRRIIGLSWSSGTEVYENGGSRPIETIYHGHSALYKKGSQLKPKANVTGGCFCRGLLDHTTKWHLPFKEHVIRYAIRPFARTDAASTIKDEISEPELYLFNSEDNLPNEKTPCQHFGPIDWNWMEDTFKIELSKVGSYPCKKVAPFIDSFFKENESFKFLGMQTHAKRGFYCSAYRLPSVGNNKDDILNNNDKYAKVILDERCLLEVLCGHVLCKKPPRTGTEEYVFSLRHADKKYNFIVDKKDIRILYVHRKEDAIKYFFQFEAYKEEKKYTEANLIADTICYYLTSYGFAACIYKPSEQNIVYDIGNDYSMQDYIAFG